MPERKFTGIMPLSDRVRAERLSGAVPEMALQLKKR